MTIEQHTRRSPSPILVPGDHSAESADALRAHAQACRDRALELLTHTENDDGYDKAAPSSRSRHRVAAAAAYATLASSYSLAESMLHRR